jgi:hypothetical protein
MADTLPHATKLKTIIRDRRSHLHLDQERVANAINMKSGEWVQMLEQGTIAVPFGNAGQLADLLKIDRQDFCRWVLFEQEPEFYADLFGTVRGEAPPDPRYTDAGTASG